MRTFATVTSVNRKILQTYGSKTLPSRPSRWEPGIEHLLVTEDADIEPTPGFRTIAMPAWQRLFAMAHFDNPFANGLDTERNRRNEHYDFRLDAVKFSHKIGAISAAWKATNADVLIWVDADVETISPVDTTWLDDLLPKGRVMAWLDRSKIYPECGFLMFDRHSKQAAGLIDALVNAYKTDEVFQFPQTHDSYLIEKFVHLRGLDPASLSGDGRHKHDVFSQSLLSRYMTHYKGRRKANV